MSSENSVEHHTFSELEIFNTYLTRQSLVWYWNFSFIVKVIPLKQNLHWDFSQTLPIDWHVYDWLLFEGILTYKTFYCPINDDDDDDDEMITMMMLMRMTTMLMGANANHPYLFTDLCSLLPRDPHILVCWWIDVYVCEGQIPHCACLVILFSFSSPWRISW